jgi:transposase InsO family protein
MDEIRTYLEDKTIPDDDASADRIARQARRYVLVERDLYRRGNEGVLLKCVTREAGVEILTDLHEGECGSHSGARTLVGKAFRQGFYWPTALQDATHLVKHCEACQFHARQIHKPALELQTIPLSWPFAVWGLDILGPFPNAVGGYNHLYVAIDKFTKWVEVEAVTKINRHSAIKFMRGIFARFGLPRKIITDNGTQFASSDFTEYCEELGVKIGFASVAHPKSNGQAERANALVLKGLKCRTFNKLKKSGKNWIEELPSVLWSVRTTPNRATGETPFFLVYGAEAMLPSELTM